MKKITKLAGLMILSAICGMGAAGEVQAMTPDGKPVIGISWMSNDQDSEGDYTAYKKIIEKAGGVAVELKQVKSNAVTYDADGKIEKQYIYPSGMLEEKYADAIKDNRFDETNIAEVMKGIDGVFFTGGEDISPTLFKIPQKEENMGEEINATRDISDYTLMSYCQKNDIPTFAVCRGEQMMGIVGGATFIQDIPTYYKDHGKTYDDLHRVPAGTPNRDYARHDVTVFAIPSHLYEITGGTKLSNISSWHHQAIGSLKGTSFIQTAETVDNGISIVEGIEDPYKTFMVGLQFHPENDLQQVYVNGKDPSKYMDTDTALKFFQELVKAAASKAAR